MSDTIRTVLITGSTKGMGKAVAHKFASESCHLILIARSEDELNLQKDELESEFNIKVYTITADLGKESGWKDCILQIHKMQLSPDVLVNNVGMFRPSSFLEEAEDDMSKMMAVNFYPAYYLTKSLLPDMIKRNTGHVFCTCSIANIYPVKEAFAYTISKYALYGFTKTLREELMNTQVKVTAVIPGSTYTSSWEGSDVPEEKFITAEDIAESIWFASNLSKGACVEEIMIRPQNGQV